MSGNEYQERMAEIYKRTRPDFSYGYGEDLCDDMGLLYAALALNGEAGEVAEKVKRIVRGDYADLPTIEVRQKVIGELGDVLYCVCMVCEEMNISLEKCMDFSLKKFTDRLKRGVIKGDGDER